MATSGTAADADDDQDLAPVTLEPGPSGGSPDPPPRHPPGPEWPLGSSAAGEGRRWGGRWVRPCRPAAACPGRRCSVMRRAGPETPEDVQTWAEIIESCRDSRARVWANHPEQAAPAVPKAPELARLSSRECVSRLEHLPGITKAACRGGCGRSAATGAYTSSTQVKSSLSRHRSRALQGGSVQRMRQHSAYRCRAGLWLAEAA